MNRLLKNTEIPYTIRMSKRAIYARISANPEGIEVTIPHNTPISYAEKFAEKKRTWIINKHQELLALKKASSEHVSEDLKGKNISELKVLLKKQVTELVVKHHEQLGRPNQIRIKEQKSRWGSCSTKGGININLKLVYAPYEVLEYVVVHELCHMTHMNHSKAFWGLVESVLPQYKPAKKWLTTNGQSLMMAV